MVMQRYSGVMPLQYVSVPVPEPLVPAVIRAVSDYLEGAGEYAPPDGFAWSASSPLGVHPSWERVATDNEGFAAHTWWHYWLRPPERDLLRVLTDAPGNRMAAPDAAAALGVSSQNLAGVIGPFNRRLRRDGFPPAIDSQLETTSDEIRRRVTHLGISADLAEIVNAYRNQTIEANPPAPTRATHKRIKRNKP